ncbi:Piso0_000197 [Millerozyma farinosa CBS 7064]|uniref:Phosphodiesterase n=1 Tax=Pichia sorbitophila (strain ATCC MYA-4447 / BCRC 22081 / CBS 7064 / NBRC 10061 / NRRL Y-12695) TaxID=559304 RepID=G8YTC3_PICSO|nr:Piso0_000197 [Millerozyma farinosa CBS 7064]
MTEVLRLRYRRSERKQTEISGYDNLEKSEERMFGRFGELIEYLYSKGNSEEDSAHATVVVVDESRKRDGNTLDGLPYEDKKALLRFFFAHLNMIVISSEDLNHSDIVEDVNRISRCVEMMSVTRSGRVATWTGVGKCCAQSSVDCYSVMPLSPQSSNESSNEQVKLDCQGSAVIDVVQSMTSMLRTSLGLTQLSFERRQYFYRLITSEIDFLRILSDSSRSHLSRLCHAVGQWSFAAHELSNDDLVYCVYLMLKFSLDYYVSECSSDIPQGLHIPSSNELLALIFTVRDTYNNGNPFHNFRHAADVLQACFYFLVRLKCLPSFEQLAADPNGEELNVFTYTFDNKEPTVLVPKADQGDSSCDVGSSGAGKKVEDDLKTLSHLKPLQSLSLLLAALGHDVGHPGVTNAFLTKYNTPTSMLYNDRSVLESFHACVFVNRILLVTWPDLLTVVVEEESKYTVRNLIVSSILATDMAEHFDYVRQLTCYKSFHNKELFQGINQLDYVKLTTSLLIKCADISNVTRPLRVSSQWALVLAREFDEIAHMESVLSASLQHVSIPTIYPKIPYHIEDVLLVRPDLRNGQIFFIDTFAESLFGSVSDAWPQLTYTKDIIYSNKSFWINFS